VVWGWNHENGGLGHGAEMVFHGAENGAEWFRAGID